MKKPNLPRPGIRVSTTALALVCLALAPRVEAQAEDPPVGIFSVVNTGREISGSIDPAIEGANTGSDATNSIRFAVGDLEFATLTLEADAPLPAIDLLAGGTERSVELDASGVLGFQITTTSEVGADFTLLHVQSGDVTLVDLDIFGSAQEDEEPTPSRFVVDAGASLGFRYSASHAIEDNIEGEGMLIKQGDASLTLIGTNAYTGGTEVEAGELRGHRDAIQGDIVIAEGARLALEDRTETGTHFFQGDITGEGTLVKEGSHTLQFGSLSGSVALSGGIEILEGILTGTTETITGNVDIESGALFDLFATNTAEEFEGNITGSGQFQKSGTDDLSLTGENTFSGGIEVVSGGLIGNSASLPGDVLLTTSSSEIRFDQTEAAGDGSHSGNISGLGKLTKLGPRTLTLSGTSSHTGDTDVLEGTLRGDTANLVGTINVSSADSSIEFALATDQVFSGNILGVGNFVKSGAGTLSLGAGHSYEGTTQVSSGTLRLQADLDKTSGVTVLAGARLVNDGGSTMIGGELVNRGSVDVGGVGDSLQVVQGGARLEADSSLLVAVNEQGQSSELKVDGNADLDRVAVAITALPGLYLSETPYVVLSAASISTGDVAIPDGPLSPEVAFTIPEIAFLEIGPLTVTGGGQQLTLTLSHNSKPVSDFAESPNQESTAPALDFLLASDSPDAEDIQASLSVVTAADVPGILDQVAGESLGAFTNPRQANAYAFAQALSRRFTANEYATGPVGRGARGGGRPAGAAGVGSGYSGGWLDAVGLFSTRSGEFNASTIEADSGGLAGGFDLALPGFPHTRIGIGAGYTRHALAGNRGLSAAGNTYQAAIYASWEKHGYYLGLAGRYAYSDMETERRIAFEDIDRLAVADFSGQEAGFLAEAGVRLGDVTRLAYRPLVRVQYNRLSQDAFQETGAGDLSLAGDAADFDSWTTTLGARISTLFTLGGEFGIEPEIRAGWTHQFGDLQRPVVARFYAVPGATPFVTNGAMADPDHLFVGTGYLMSVGDVPLVGVDYDYYTGDGYHLHVVSARLYLRW